MEIIILVLFILILGGGLFLYLKVMQDPQEETVQEKIKEHDDVPNGIIRLWHRIRSHIGIVKFIDDIKKSMLYVFENLMGSVSSYTQEQKKKDKKKLYEQIQKSVINHRDSNASYHTRSVSSKFHQRLEALKNNSETYLDLVQPTSKKVPDIDTSATPTQYDDNSIDTYWDDDPAIVKNAYNIMKNRGRAVARPLALRYNPKVGYSQWGFSLEKEYKDRTYDF
jgi:hypothetical protein